MLQPDKVEFVKIINGLSALKPSTKLTADAIELFWNALADWPMDEFRSAANVLNKTCEFMPNPYHFEQLRKSAGVGKHQAWAEARKRCVQSIEHPNDRITRAAQLVGGYYEIGHTLIKDMPFLANRFMAAYEEIGEAEQARQALPNHVSAIDKLEAKKVMNRLMQGVA